MNDPFVLVWRPSEGAAIATFSEENKSPRAFSDPSVAEAAGSEGVTEEELEKLLESRATFDIKRVPVQVAERLLGWTVTQAEGTSE